MRKEVNLNFFGISGKKRSGKNLVAKLINEILVEEKKDVYEEKAFAFILKRIASILTGIPEDEWETDEQKDTELGPEWTVYDEQGLKIPLTRRSFMTRFGTDACTARLHPMTWINALYKDYKAGVFTSPKWMVTDVRFPLEASSIVNRKGVLIRIMRPETDKLSGNHASETSLDNYDKWDHIIVNDCDLVELKSRVKQMMLKLGMID